MVLVALIAIVLIAFVALAVDGGNAYAIRREAQSAADAAAIAGTWVMVDYRGFSPVSDILYQVNQYAQQNGVPDTNGDPGDIINDNVKAYYVYFDGSCLLWENECWELHNGPSIIPPGARGIEVDATISQTTFFARAIGVSQVQASAQAAATYRPDGGILPIAVNEYWYGAQGHPENCPYENCGPPYSFVRTPAQLPPFRQISSSPERWERNACPDPYNEDTCQGAYEGYSENFAQAFCLMGQDAYPADPSRQPRSAVVLDYRYDALNDDGLWHFLIDNDIWEHGVAPLPPGQGQQAMEEVIADGGYKKTPLPRALHEPPPAYYSEDWGYCWQGPPNADNCFNYPVEDRSAPYDVLQFLYGTQAGHLAHTMVENNYQDGRYAPGQHIVIMVYNGYPGNNWGQSHNWDCAVVVGYFGAVIVGYGNEFETPDAGPGCSKCRCNGTPGDWESYVHCIRSNGNPTSVYGLASPDGPLTIDPTQLIDEFLPKKISLIK